MKIVYGNPPLEYVQIMQRPNDHIKDWFLQTGNADLIIDNAPDNDSETTLNDLNELMMKMSSATGEELTFARYIDDVSNLAQSFIDLMYQHGHTETMETFFMIDGQTEGILHYLKDVINRPRPYQLAKYFHFPIYPLIRTDAMSAAYPSGHALTAFVMSRYYANKYPEISEKILELGERIANSREITGIHYPSDTRVSREMCDIIFNNNLIKE